MKKQLLITLSLIALLSSCSTEEEVDRPSFKALSFETFVGKGTPTRAVAKTDFAEGDDFGVIAYRHGTDPWTDGVAKELFMDNVEVTRQGGEWVYSPARYWEEGINHTFLAYSPYNAGYLFSEGVLTGVATATEASGQIDLLYSIPDTGSKNLVWEEKRKVMFNFRHALSQIRISASTDRDYSGYYTVTVRGVKLTGIHNTGSLNLNTSDTGASPWSAQTTIPGSGYAVVTGELNIPLSTTEILLNSDSELFMQLPQEIPDGAATFEITCDIVATEAGDAANIITGKVVSVKIPMINWEHNYIYHYRVQMNLQQILGLKPVELEEPTVELWETETETQLPKTAISPAKAYAKNASEANGSYLFTISAPPGKKWTVRTPTLATVYALNAYMTLVYDGNTYPGVNSSFSGIGSGEVTVIVSGFNVAITNVMIGLFTLIPEGETSLGGGIRLLPDN